MASHPRGAARLSYSACVVAVSTAGWLVSPALAVQDARPFDRPGIVQLGPDPATDGVRRVLIEVRLAERSRSEA
jgi:hypothetical protein